MNPEFNPKIDVFYCANSVEYPTSKEGAATGSIIQMACSAMIKDVYILKAFESGADGVLVVGCPAGKCKRVDGNIRAGKRVAFIQKLLDEIGLGGQRLVYASSDEFASALSSLVEKLVAMGPRKKLSEAKIAT
jgi:F420-non-reducing hydrogenase iron-sulfur subunit